MHAVVETPRYEADAQRLFSVMEREAVVDLVSNDPRCGVVVPGSGARVLYVYGGDEIPVFLLAAFAKNEKDDLSPADRARMAKAISNILADHRRAR
jgi:hypothetical protein